MVNITDILPYCLKQDEFVIALSEAFEIEMKKLSEERERISNLQDFNNLDEKLLDYLAYQKHVDFYLPGLPIETKRELLKNSTFTHKIKGTRQAVESLITTVFGEGTVEEWYEYGGEPYHFKVQTESESATNVQAAEFVQAINTVKNARSIFDNIVLIKKEEAELYWGGMVHVASTELYKQV